MRDAFYIATVGAVLLFIALFMMRCASGAHTSDSRPHALDPINRTLERLATEEGYVSHAYRDSRGFLTIGYAFNIDAGISESEAVALLRAGLHQRALELQNLWPPLGRMPPGVQSALLDMAYELGPSGLSEFHVMLAALERRDWNAASVAALDSEWAREVPGRAKAIAALIAEEQR